MMIPIQNSLVPRQGLISNFVICVKDFSKFLNGAKPWKSKSIINLCSNKGTKTSKKIDSHQKIESLSYAKRKKSLLKRWESRSNKKKNKKQKIKNQIIAW